MALDILHDNWGPYTHTEVENALKAYLAVLENRINQAIQSGGVGLTDLSAEVQALLNKANTALQPENIAAWAKAQNKPGYTADEITGVEGFQNLLAKLQDMDQKIHAAAQSGGVDPDDEMSSTSEKPVQNKVIKAYVDAAVLTLQNALNTLMNGQNVTDAIDTFNEVVTFLNGIDTDDPKLFNQLKSLSDAITALQTALAGKISGIRANGASTTLPVDQNGVVELPPAGSTISPATAAPAMDGTAAVGTSLKYAREDHVHPKDTSKQDVISDLDAIRSGAALGSTALQSHQPLKTINGNNIVGIGNITIQGEKGETGSCAITGDGSNIIALIVNDLVTGGAGNILSAEQGKRLAPLLELIGTVEHPSETESVALTSGKRYDGNLYSQPTSGTFPTTTNSNSGWGCAAVEVKEGDVLKIIGTKSGADYRIYTIVDASNQRISVGSSANNQSYTSSSPLEVTMPANAAKVYVNLTYSGAAVSVVRSAWIETLLNRATSLQDGLMTKEQVAAFEELSEIVDGMGANSELLSTLIENVTIPATTKNVQMTSGGRYDGNYYTTGNTGVFPTTINSNSGWSYGNIACKEGDVLTIVGSKSGADYKIYTIVDADNKRISSGASSDQTYTSDSPLNVTMPANAAKVYINLSSVTSVKLTEPSYNEDQLRKATTEQDGLMTKEQVAALEAAGGEDVELLKSYIVDRTDTMTGTFVVGNLKNWNVAIGATYNGGLGDDNQNMVYCVFSVQAGDIVTLWCTTDAWNQGYIICDSSNKVIAKSGNNYSKSQSSPEIKTIEQDGKIWIASNKSASYGASLSRTYRAFRNATAEQDGLMSKEIAALFGGGDVSGDDAASLKLKSFAFIGDSFSSPGSWQSTMCSILGSMVKANKAIDGGAWYGTGNKSAYYQAQQLVSNNQAADYILCVLGTNDIAHWSDYTLGDIVNSETIGTASGNVNPSGSITGGIQATLITLKNAFPNAIIKIGYTPAGYIHDAFNQIANVEALCNRLKEISHIYGVGYIETRDCGICKWMEADLHAYTGTTSGGEWASTGHPSGAGQTRIGHYMARIMMSNL